MHSSLELEVLGAVSVGPLLWRENRCRVTVMQSRRITARPPGVSPLQAWFGGVYAPSQLVHEHTWCSDNYLDCADALGSFAFKTGNTDPNYACANPRSTETSQKLKSP